MTESRDIRLAMLGMVEGNGHPYSWSAIFNGYDPEIMGDCPYPAIPEYLDREPKESLQIQGARVTHIWTDDPAQARHVARASRIPHVVSRAEEVIGHVDAVIIAADKGHEHVARCRPFVQAGLPIFVDKPLTDNEPDLVQFSRWVAAGQRILSSSCMRYAREFSPYRTLTHDLGTIRYASITTPKSWERYGIHALEGVYPILGPGFLSARNSGTPERNIVHLEHECGADTVIAAIHDMAGAFGVLTLGGTSGHASVSFADTFYAFKAQLLAFVDYVRTGQPPFPFSQTVELMTIIIAGIRSRQEGGRKVLLSEIADS